MHGRRTDRRRSPHQRRQRRNGTLSRPTPTTPGDHRSLRNSIARDPAASPPTWPHLTIGASQKFRTGPSGPARNAPTGHEWPRQTRDQNWDRTWDRLSAFDRDDPKSSAHKGSADRHHPTRAPRARLRPSQRSGHGVICTGLIPGETAGPHEGLHGHGADRERARGQSDIDAGCYPANAAMIFFVERLGSQVRSQVPLAESAHDSTEVHRVSGSGAADGGPLAPVPCRRPFREERYRTGASRAGSAHTRHSRVVAGALVVESQP